MAFRKGPEPRVRITETGRVLHIVIPARRCWFTVSTRAFWLCLWTIVFLVRVSEHPPFPTILQSILFWVVGSLLVGIQLLWNFRGRETVVVEGTTLWIRRAIGNRGYTREFRLAHITDLSPQEYWGLQFCYGDRCLSFAEGARKSELTPIAKAIKRRLVPCP